MVVDGWALCDGGGVSIVSIQKIIVSILSILIHKITEYHSNHTNTNDN